MNYQDFKRYTSNARANLSLLLGKAKNEPEYRRLCILLIVLAAALIFVTPWLGILISAIGVWYLTY